GHRDDRCLGVDRRLDLLVGRQGGTAGQEGRDRGARKHQPDHRNFSTRSLELSIHGALPQNAIWVRMARASNLAPMSVPAGNAGLSPATAAVAAALFLSTVPCR